MGERERQRVSAQPGAGGARRPASSHSEHGQRRHGQHKHRAGPWARGPWPEHDQLPGAPGSPGTVHLLSVPPLPSTPRPGPTSPPHPPPRPPVPASASGALPHGTVLLVLRSRLDCHLVREAFPDHPIGKHPPHHLSFQHCSTSELDLLKAHLLRSNVGSWGEGGAPVQSQQPHPDLMEQNGATWGAVTSTSGGARGSMRELSMAHNRGPSWWAQTRPRSASPKGLVPLATRPVCLPGQDARTP